MALYNFAYYDYDDDDYDDNYCCCCCCCCCYYYYYCHCLDHLSSVMTFTILVWR